MKEQCFRFNTIGWRIIVHFDLLGIELAARRNEEGPPVRIFEYERSIFQRGGMLPHGVKMKSPLSVRRLPKTKFIVNDPEVVAQKCDGPADSAPLPAPSGSSRKSFAKFYPGQFGVTPRALPSKIQLLYCRTPLAKLKPVMRHFAAIFHACGRVAIINKRSGIDDDRMSL